MQIGQKSGITADPDGQLKGTIIHECSKIILVFYEMCNLVYTPNIKVVGLYNMKTSGLNIVAYCNRFDQRVARQQLCKQSHTNTQATIR
jgi:hypothetical protein